MGGIGSGGLRHGAGRPAEDGSPRERLSLSLPAWLADGLRREARRRGVSLSSLASDILEKNTWT